MLSKINLQRLIEERTKLFYNLPSEHSSWYSFRLEREEAEKEIPRHKEDIYLCPFLGLLKENGKVGCLIHPENTNTPNSQNASFYGSSICQKYQCPNHTAENHWHDLFAKIANDWIEYSMMAGDHIFKKTLVVKHNITSKYDFKLKKQEIEAAYRKKFLQEKTIPVTSFEVQGIIS